MKKLSLFLFIAAILFTPLTGHAAEEYRKTISPTTATVITHPLVRGVFVGVTADYDFYIDGAWVLFKNCTAGTILPIRVTGARDADDTDAEAGDLLLLY